MGQDKPNVDALFARMFGGTQPLENASGGENEDADSQTDKLAVKPPAKAQRHMEGNTVEENATEPPDAPVNESKPKVKKEKKTAAKGEVKYFGGSKVNSHGRVHVSYWIETRLVAAIDRRCARERLLGRTGEKSGVVESALAEYLTKELDEVEDELM